MEKELCRLTIHEADKLLKRKRVSSLELTEAVLRRIEVEEKLKAFVTVSPALVRQQVRKVDGRSRSGDFSPLTGIPARSKGNFCTKEVRTTYRSRMLGKFTPFIALQ